MKDNKRSAILSAIITVLGITTTVLAGNSKSAAQDAYEQIVVNNQDTAVVYVDEDTETAEVIEALMAIDNETPYDAEMATYRAPSYSTTRYQSGKLEITLNNALKVQEADKILDEMESEIRNNLKDGYTQKEALTQITRYIKNTFSYNRDDRNDEGYLKNFVDAYNSDKKIACSQYAALTYLLCNRFGIEAKIVTGNEHAYNAIKLDTDSTYKAYDMTKTSLKVLPVKVSYTDVITGTYSINLEPDRFTKTVGIFLNDRIDYTYSITYQDVLALAFLTGIIVLTVIAIRRDGKRSHRRHHR